MLVIHVSKDLLRGINMSIKILIQTIEIEGVTADRLFVVENPDVNLMKYLDERKTNGYTLLFHNYYSNSRFTSFSDRYPFIIKDGKCEWHVPIEEVSIRDFATTHKIGPDGTIIIEEGGVGGWGDIDSFLEVLTWIILVIDVYGRGVTIEDISKRVLRIYHKLIGKDGKIAGVYELADYLKTRKEWSLHEIYKKTTNIDKPMIEMILLQQGFVKEGNRYVLKNDICNTEIAQDSEFDEGLDAFDYELEEIKRCLEDLNNLIILLYIYSKGNNNCDYYVVEKMIDYFICENSNLFRKGDGATLIEMNMDNRDLLEFDSLSREIDFLSKYIIVLCDSARRCNVLQNEYMEPLKRGDIVQHFKRELMSDEERETNKYLYEIIGVAHHSETREPMMVYRPLYDDGGMYVRPLDMFLSEVDHEKYPDVEQKYRFEKVQYSNNE